MPFTQIMTTLKNYLLNLNFFQSSHTINQPQDQHQHQHEHRSNIIATRFYIIIFTVTLLTLILALWLTPQITKVSIQYPTQQQFQALPQDVYCPCSRISLSYGQFISIQTKSHQVCSSDFVSDRWIKSIFYGSSIAYYYRSDFRVIGGAQFRALASLCDLTRTSIVQSLLSFNLMLMISPNVLSKSVVQSQSQTSIEQFQLTTANTFEKQLDFVRKMIIGNQLISALETNIVPIYSVVDGVPLQVVDYMIYNMSNESYCDCQANIDCRVPSGIFQEYGLSADDAFYSVNRLTLMKIDGFSAGCMPMDSILQSSLQCFYNETCLNQLLSYLSTNETFTAMNISNHSRFSLTSTVKELVNKLMVEEWITNISYEKYYNQCAPIVCTYSRLNRHSSLYVVTKVIGSLGGLTLTLTFIIPILVRLIRRKKNVGARQISICAQICQFRILIKDFLIQLNFFEDHPSTNRQIKYQRIASRFYLFIFVVSLAILTFYTLITHDIYQETILQPNDEQFNKLQQMYPSTLSCPCTNISVPFNSFIQIQPFYHQVCSSDMTSQRWIDYYSTYVVYVSDSYLDIRTDAGPQFQILIAFCQQAQQTVNDSLQLFLQQQFVTSQLISQPLFQSRINESIEQWKSNTLNSFLRPIQLIRITNQANQLINALHNFQFTRNTITKRLIPISANYSNCSCATSSTCRTNMGIFTFNSTTYQSVEIFRIPNFFTGCFPVESLLESTLECFYDNECISTIEYFMGNTTSHFSPLNATINSPNETVQSIINRLMIDSWISNISFSNYYKMCAPLSCTYEYTHHHDIFYLISSILGIFAGLSLGIKLLIVISLRFIEKIAEDFSFSGLKRRIKSIFVCQNEQQITNRLHFILLLFTLSILYLISSLTVITQTEQIIKPNVSIYQNLVNNYEDSLQCPCSQISIEYQSFLHIIPHMHEICSSEFMLDDWIDYISESMNRVELNSSDFGRTRMSQYQLLVSFCELSKEVVNDGLINLASSHFIDSRLLPSNLLNERIQVLVKEFEIAMPSSFLDSLSIIRETTGANMLMNVYMTNWKFTYKLMLFFMYIVHAVPLAYDGCSCGISSKCVQSSQGMMVGCYPLEALLQSTLQCFYNQTCIDSTNTFQALSTSSNISSRFSKNSTIELILHELMVKDYSINISYENYFSQCKPLWCSYSYVGYRDIIEVTSTIIGLYGGLAIIVKCFAVLLIKLCLCRKRQINPETSEENN